MKKQPEASLKHIVIEVRSGVPLASGQRILLQLSRAFDLPDGQIEDLVEHLRQEADRLSKHWEDHLEETRQ